MSASCWQSSHAFAFIASLLAPCYPKKGNGWYSFDLSSTLSGLKGCKSRSSSLSCELCLHHFLLGRDRKKFHMLLQSNTIARHHRMKVSGENENTRDTIRERSLSDIFIFIAHLTRWIAAGLKENCKQKRPFFKVQKFGPVRYSKQLQVVSGFFETRARYKSKCQGSDRSTAVRQCCTHLVPCGE